MKKLALFSTVACMVVLLAGCGNQRPTEERNTTPTEEIVTTGDIITTGDDMAAEIATGDIVNKNYSLAHIATHSTESDCRTAINGKVYDVTAFFGKHPGGDKNLFRVCGIDATQAFNTKHGNDEKPNNVLAGFEIGTLAK